MSPDGNLSNTEFPYTVPQWSGPPPHRFLLELREDGLSLNKFNVHEKGYYVFGTKDLCDFTLHSPTISPFHAVLQFKSEGAAYIYDLASKHGTSVNNNQVNQREYVELHVGDMIQFGGSPQLYVLEGPTDLTSPGNSNGEKVAMADAAQEKQDQLAASLNDLFISVSTMVKGELQGTNNLLELLEKMNLRVAEEYKGFGDLASGLSVFVEQLKSKSDNFDEYVQQVDAIENQFDNSVMSEDWKAAMIFSFEFDYFIECDCWKNQVEKFDGMWLCISLMLGVLLC